MQKVIEVEGDNTSYLFQSLDLNNARVEDFEDWIKNVYADTEVRKPAPEPSQIMPVGDTERQWQNLKQPVFYQDQRTVAAETQSPQAPKSRGEGSAGARSMSGTAPHAMREETSRLAAALGIPTDLPTDEPDDPWGTRWQPTVIKEESSPPLLVAAVSRAIDRRSLSPLVYRGRSGSPGRVVVRRGSPPRMGERLEYKAEASPEAKEEVVDSEWKRRMGANRRELQELADSIPSRVVTPNGVRMTVNQDPMGLTTYVLDSDNAVDLHRSRYYYG